HLLPRRAAEADLMSELRSAPGPGDPVTPAEQRPWPGLDVAGLTILVAGFGGSGYAVADQTMQRGAQVLVVGGADTPEIRERAKILEVLGVQIRLGARPTGALPAEHAAALVVASPGGGPGRPPRAG